jgi:hypothetical protein
MRLSRAAKRCEEKWAEQDIAQNNSVLGALPLRL